MVKKAQNSRTELYIFGRWPTNSWGMTSGFIFKLANDFLVHCAVESVVWRVVGSIKQVQIKLDIVVKVFRVDLVTEAVSIGKQQLGSLSVLVLDVLLMELVHQDFGEV